MKKFLSTLVAAGFLFGYVPAYPGAKHDMAVVQENYSRVPHEKALEAMISEIIRYHEKNTGVMYGSKRPGIYIDEDMKEDGIAEYDSELECICLHPRYRDVDVSVFKDIVSGEGARFREILSHELGHFLTDVYVSRYAPGSWLAENYSKNMEKVDTDTGLYLIVEGIGEYFGRIFYDEKSTSGSRWLERRRIDEFGRNQFDNWLVYVGGWDLVAPILDIDAHRGMIWLIEHELDIDSGDLSEIPIYQERAMRELMK